MNTVIFVIEINKTTLLLIATLYFVKKENAKSVLDMILCRSAS